MKQVVIAVGFTVMISGSCLAASRSIEMSATPQEAVLGESVRLECTAEGGWRSTLRSATISVEDARGRTVVRRDSMQIDGLTASYDLVLPSDRRAGEWEFRCSLRDRSESERETGSFTVVASAGVEPPVVEPEPPVVEPEPPVVGPEPPVVEPEPPVIEPEPPVEVVLEDAPIAAHNSITAYDGPATCIGCHEQEAAQMLDTLHMRWSGPTPELVNTNGEERGKAVGGINTFCTYAVSSKGACYSCHVRADGNAPHPPEATDVDCLMCHSDTYQRKFVPDPENTETVTNILGEERTYVFGKVDAEGNYLTVPDFDAMPAGTAMVNVARTVHLPTSASCLRCHAKAGGGDWTKRGDLGLSSAHPAVEEDVHLSPNGANLSCVNCHSALDHKIAGRGIDLRQTEAPAPTCQACHSDAPHSNATLNRHAEGQVSCQVCHIREYAKGGATEMSRDWRIPVWNAAFCSGQGGFVGEEVKESFVKPEYVWFDRNSYVYNVGDVITPDPNGVYHMAKALGTPFDGRSSIVPIKRHFSVMPLHESGQIIPPAIMWMFMTGDFDTAVRKGMEEQGLQGNYSLVQVDAEMLITHGVEPKEKAPSCTDCHDNTGSTPDGTGMLPFTELGYHEVPEAVQSCTLCHERKSLQWESMHQRHRNDNVYCFSCHTPEPTGLVQESRQLCSSCHENKSWRSEGHKKHLEKGLECVRCHTFS